MEDGEEKIWDSWANWDGWDGAGSLELGVSLEIYKRTRPVPRPEREPTPELREVNGEQ